MACTEVAANPPFSHRASHKSPPLHLPAIALAAGLLFAALSVGAAELRGEVIGVSDGDTITVIDQARKPRKVRLAGIDAPEMRQPYGQHAKRNLAALVFGKPVVVLWHKVDRYGRVVGHVHVVVAGECG